MTISKPAGDLSIAEAIKETFKRDIPLKRRERSKEEPSEPKEAKQPESSSADPVATDVKSTDDSGSGRLTIKV